MTGLIRKQLYCSRSISRNTRRTHESFYLAVIADFRSFVSAPAALVVNCKHIDFAVRILIYYFEIALFLTMSSRRVSRRL